VTKGTGLPAALDELGLSPHNAIAAGDAENDLALLQAAEVGAAVANAVPSPTAHADPYLGSPKRFRYDRTASRAAAGWPATTMPQAATGADRDLR
jgi:phosphoserine phosphatase